jgi:ACS family glucarate transporter-like MFS transporter
MTFLLVISALTLLDRLNLSIAGKFIQDQYHIGNETMGWILSAFVLGYALFQVPGGWLGDRYGPRTVMTIAIVWWSVLTAATAIAPRLPLVGWFGLAWSFAIVRFLIGMGEGAAFPNANKIVAFWMGKAGRGVGNSMFLAGIGVGGSVTPMFIAWVTKRWGWRASFCACGCAGVLVALGWHLYVTNRPEEHPRVNIAELAEIRANEATLLHGSPSEYGPSVSPPWGKMLSNVSVWGLVLSYFCLGYPSYVYYTWFYLYLVQARGLTVMQGGFWGATPFLAMALLTPLGGWFSDFAVDRLRKQGGRRSAVWLGLACSAALLWLGSSTANNTLAILLLAGAAGFIGFATPSWWATCNDLTRNFSGSLSGLMNMCGNVGGWIAPILTPYLATHFGWRQALHFAALPSLIAGILWFMVSADPNLGKRAS